MTTLTANAILTRLARACRAAGLDAEIVEPSAKVRVSNANAHPKAAEIITLKSAPDGGLCFWWSWDRPFCPAEDIDTAVQRISGVVSITSI